MEIPEIKLEGLNFEHHSDGKKRRLLHYEDGKFILRIDNSSSEDFVMCAFAGKIKKVLGRVPPTSAPLVYGGAAHAGLDVRYRHLEDRGSETLVNMMAEAVVKKFEGFTPALDEWRTVDRCIDTLQRYLKKYPTEPFSVHQVDGVPQVEVPFSIPLGVIELNCELAYDWETLVDPEEWPDGTDGGSKVYVDDLHIFWTGRIDAVIQMDNRLWVMDHKTSSIVGPTYWKEFELSQATLGYTFAGQEIYAQPVSGLLANVLIGRKPTKTGTPTDFQRQRFYYSPARLNRWKKNITSIITNFVHRLVDDDFPQETKWCSGKYGMCPFHDECCLDNEELTIQALYTNKFADNTWSPLDV